MVTSCWRDQKDFAFDEVVPRRATHGSVMALKASQWAFKNWVTACEAMTAFDTPTMVLCCGPVIDPDGIRAFRGYLVHIDEQAEAAYSNRSIVG